MYEKYTLILMLFFLILVSCNAKKNPEDKRRSGAAKANSPLSGGNTNGNTNSLHKSYEIIKNTYTDENVKISYPQITHLSNASLEKKINEILKGDAFKVLNDYGGISDDLTLDLNYAIKLKSDNLLSICYSGLGNVKGTAHPNHIFYTTNINIPNGSRIKLKDIISIDDNFIKKLKKAKYIAWEAHADKELESAIYEQLNSLDDDMLKNMLMNADSLDGDVFSYLTKDSLGISLGVPHALGDHAEFEMKYSDIKNNIKTESVIWNEFYQRSI